MAKTFKVEILKAEGTCNSDLFKMLAENGDLNATKVKDIMGMNVTITGYAKTHIAAKDKEFDVTYFDTDEYGICSAGSEIFTESLETYFGKVTNFIIKEIKTNKGTTYKATPVLKQQKVAAASETSDDLPF